MVYLKVQPYKKNVFGLRGSLKLRSKFYRPFMIVHRVGNVLHKLQLPSRTDIHPVFHVSQLKQHVGHRAIPLPHVPLVKRRGTSRRTQQQCWIAVLCNATRHQWNTILCNGRASPPAMLHREDAMFLNNHFSGHKLFQLKEKSIIKREALSGHILVSLKINTRSIGRQEEFSQRTLEMERERIDKIVRWKSTHYLSSSCFHWFQTV